jgi:AcrR family transcriptional regulator
MKPDAPDMPREDGRVRRARAQKLARRAHILDTARRLFAERGFHETSLSALITSADIARGTFYLHFDSKEAAFRAILEDLLAGIRADVRPVDTTSLIHARVQLEDNLARAFRRFFEDPGLAVLLLRQSASISPELSHNLDAFFGAITALAERSLRAGQTLGLVRPGDVSLMARLALGLFKESALLVSPTHPPEALARDVLALVLQGVLTAGSTPAPRDLP